MSQHNVPCFIDRNKVKGSQPWDGWLPISDASGIMKTMMANVYPWDAQGMELPYMSCLAPSAPEALAEEGSTLSFNGHCAQGTGLQPELISR